MSQEPALLQAILDDPDDDALRLVYADWLEEHGDVRGEFIRVQIELGRLKRTDPGYRALWNRELDLIRTYKEEWFGSMRKRFTAWDVRRGFINEVAADLPVFMEHAAELCTAHPVEKVVLEGRSGPRSALPGWVELLQQFLRSDWLHCVPKLELHCNPSPVDDSFGRQLAERGPWPRLKSLRLATFAMSMPMQARLRELFGERLTLVVPETG